MLGVGGLEHGVARPRVVVPPAVRFDVHRTELPLPQRIVDACREALFLLVHADFEPDLDQLDAAVDDVFLDLRDGLEEVPVLLLGAEAHDGFDAGAVVVAAVEDHDLAGGRKPLDVALGEHLGLLAIGRRRQRHDAEHPRADALGYRLDRSALAGCVAAFEDDDDAQAFVFDPCLQVTQFDLQLAQFLLVDFALELAFAVERSLGARHGDMTFCGLRAQPVQCQLSVTPTSPGMPLGKSTIWYRSL